MYLIVDYYRRYHLKAKTLLSLANSSLILSFLAFFVSLIVAYGLESQLPLMLITVLHVVQLFLAGVFKFSYVLRMTAQQQLGQVPG